MKIAFPVVFALLIAMDAMGWGQTGHRVVGQIAELHLSAKVKKKVNAVLQGQSIAMVSNFMDEIKSEPVYDSLGPWHYCTIEDISAYNGAPPEGDIIMAINEYVRLLKTGTLSPEQEAFSLKCLIHLVGDVHQPLHVGKGDDRGGNDVKVTYFGENVNLHQVWDSGIIDGQKLSYTEYTAWINHATKEQIDQWKKDNLMTWVAESISCRPQIYKLPENGRIGYRYNYDNIGTVNLRLLQAGIRLAALLESIYN